MNSLEPANVIITVFSLFVAPHVAEILGSYSVILLASVAGAGWALGREGGKLDLKNALLFFAKINLTALVFTVPVAYIIATKYGVNDPQYLLAPIAFIIGFVGNDWVKLNTTILSKARALVTFLLSKEK